MLLLPLLCAAQYDFFESKIWSDFIEEKMLHNDTVIAIGSGYEEREDSECPKLFEKIIILYPNDEGDWFAEKVIVGKIDTVFSKTYYVCCKKKRYIRSNLPKLKELFVSNAGFKGRNVSGGGAISFYMKIGDEVIHENYFNISGGGIVYFLDTELELFFMYYSIGNNVVP